MKDKFINSIGIYGRWHYEHLIRTHITSVNVMRMNETLEDYLKSVNYNAEEMFSQLVKQLAENEGITEQLKADDQMEWICRMNSIRNRAEEIVKSEVIFV